MSQDLNPNPSTCSSLVIFTYWACERHGSIFLVLRLESSSGYCTKLHTVVATNNRDQPTRHYIACSRHIYSNCVLLYAHITFVVNRTFHATPTESLQKHPLLFAVNPTDRTFFLWRLHLAPPSHPGRSTTLLRLESSSGKCAKLHIVAAGNSRNHTSCWFYFCFFAPYIYGCCSSHTFLSWWIAHSAKC